ncbi:DNA glycosylase [Trametes versicolor FP-101664 SS1]|uniref:DNA glycosylase n=1 Tax=Trametes versicolor (strain FP-101664) TaxID=717944 RepID=UPI0004621400|nr:DNA glycosylase [Trametes versicolor FP-101664 SS1]EIW63535.1 DNA glycosylase [Trametes versicolor FP-101664 SS1]
MALTRSATRSTGATPEATQQTTAAAQTKAADSSRKRTRKSPDAAAEPAQKKPRVTKAKTTKAAVPTASSVKTSPAAPNTAVPTPIPNAEGEELVPAVLTFSFEEAKRHLVRVDPRFDDVFRRVKCRPFEHLERVDPFRLTVGARARGQQISWKAAASITHKFVRLFDPSLPESLADSKSNFFPSAHQVITKDIATLRSAGLSGRKAEYVLDLAGRFADGRLSTRKLLLADDEELYKMLIEVRGIGRLSLTRATVDMFAMFSLRRPDILPVGKSSRWDLGVQKGMLRWFVSLHSPSTHPVSLRKDKLSKEDETSAVAGTSLGPEGEGGSVTMLRAATPDASSILPAPDVSVEPVPTPKGKGKKKAADDGGSENPLPAPFTPSIAQTLNMKTTTTEDGGKYTPPPLPEGLTVAVMKNRLSGKKVKGALLTPKEMEDLAECWQPYRSLGVYYMWALAEEPK